MSSGKRRPFSPGLNVLNTISMEADNPRPDVSWLSLIPCLILDWTIELMVANSNNARLDTEQHREKG